MAENPSTVELADITPHGFDQPVSETLPDVIQKIVQESQPEKIILFGSYAYGSPTPDSDVDLLVILKSPESPRERFLKVARSLRPRLFPVDLLVKTPEEIEYAVESGDFFLNEILDRGRVLHER
jgi:predicted nucleotidyltransferase